MDYFAPSMYTNRYRQACEADTGAIPGLHIDDVGTQWPDWLGSGGGHPDFFVSERVLRSLEEAEIPYRRAIEMPIASIGSPALRKIPPPLLCSGGGCGNGH